MSHPLQDMELDSDGVIRFRRNKIVEYLLDNGSQTMNSLAVLPFSAEDREQFAQLIGYSVDGFADLSYVSDETIKKADKKAEKLRLYVQR